MTIFAEMRDDLLASELAHDVTWYPQPPGAEPITGLRALMASRDRVDQLGDIQARDDVVTVELSRAALVSPGTGDVFEMLGRRYVAQAVRPSNDDPDLWWLVTGYVERWA